MKLANTLASRPGGGRRVGPGQTSAHRAPVKPPCTLRYTVATLNCRANSLPAGWQYVGDRRRSGPLAGIRREEKIGALGGHSPCIGKPERYARHIVSPIYATDRVSMSL